MQPKSICLTVLNDVLPPCAVFINYLITRYENVPLLTALKYCQPVLHHRPGSLSALPNTPGYGPELFCASYITGLFLAVSYNFLVLSSC